MRYGSEQTHALLRLGSDHGPKLPKGEHYLTIGWKQIWHALKQYKRLPYTFVYLFAFFLLADVSLYILSLNAC